MELVRFDYLIRIFDIYFFWESKPLGFAFLLVFLAVFLRKDITTRKTKKLKNVLSHIGFWLIVFILFVKVLMLIILPNSDAHNVANIYIENNSDLEDEIGKITGYTTLPSGGIQITTNSNGTYGSTTISFIIKGESKFIEQTIYLNKTTNEDWVVIATE